MKILSISDVEINELSGQFDCRPFKDVELILSCGDLPPEYLSNIRERLDRPLFYVKGNHDIRYENASPKGCVICIGD
jgi:predicted phosphodiesterase